MVFYCWYCFWNKNIYIYIYIKLYKRVTLITKTISWYWSAGRHDQYIRKLSLGEIVQVSLDLVPVSGAMGNTLFNFNAQSQHSTRVNTNNEIQAKKTKRSLAKIWLQRLFSKLSSSLLLPPESLDYPPCIHGTCRYCSDNDSAYSWEIRVKGEGAV